MQGLIQNLTKMEIELNEHRYVVYDFLYLLFVYWFNYTIIGVVYIHLMGGDVMWGRMLWF